MVPVLLSRDIHLALNSVVSNIQTLGTPPSFDLALYGGSLYRKLLDRIVGLDGWRSLRKKAAVQALWDLLFLKKLVRVQAGGKVEEERAGWDELVGLLSTEVCLFCCYLV